MKKRVSCWLLGSLAAVTLVVATGSVTSPARADTVISTLAAWDGVTNANPWGPVGATGTPSPTYGQTFIDPTGVPYLQSMTFEIKNTGAALTYQAYVYAWDSVNKGITGSAAFSSAPLTLNNTGTVYQQITVSTGGIALTPGSTYVAFFSTIGDGGPSNGSASWGAIGNDTAYANGTFVYNNSTTIPGLFVPANPAWGNPGYDLAFALDFSPGPLSVPEPSPVTLGGLATVACGLPMFLRRWRRRKV